MNKRIGSTKPEKAGLAPSTGSSTTESAVNEAITMEICRRRTTLFASTLFTTILEGLRWSLAEGGECLLCSVWDFDGILINYTKKVKFCWYVKFSQYIPLPWFFSKHWFYRIFLLDQAILIIPFWLSCLAKKTPDHEFEFSLREITFIVVISSV